MFNSCTRRRVWALLFLCLQVCPRVQAVDFEFSYIDNAEQDFFVRGWLDQDSLFQRNIRAAAGYWGSRLDSAVVIDVEVISDRIGRAGGTHSLGNQIGFDSSGNAVFEPSPLTAILNGINPSGTEIFITIDAEYVDAELWIDPSPEDLGDTNPVGTVDFISVIMHEFGHGWGFCFTDS